jgi:pyrimidine-nucleoside phosphorylase
LICSSIIGKKKAEGTDALALDVKLGRGAFFKTRDETIQLANSLVSLGNLLGIKTVALLTGMDQPLGNAVGNWLEVVESVDVLRGRGPKDVIDVTLALGAVMLVLGGKTGTIQEGIPILEKLIASGAAYEKFLAMVKAQGGDVSAVENPGRIPSAAFSMKVESPVDGWISELDAYEIGLLAVGLGAGRIRKEDAIDPLAGIVFHKKIGDKVRSGDILAIIYSQNKNALNESSKRLLSAYQFLDISRSPNPLMDCIINEKGECSTFDL